MLYFFDTCVLIDAATRDFPIEENVSFWDWLLNLATNDILKIPEKVFEELKKHDDGVYKWLANNKQILIDPVSNSYPSISLVLQKYGYTDELDIEKLHADPFIIAHAHHRKATVVTHEIPSNATLPHNVKIPTVCVKLKVPCIRLTQFIWELK